jgi:hypothetical protein
MKENIAHASFDECQAALAHVLDAPKDKATIKQLCIRPGFEQRLFPDEVSLTVASGIKGDGRWLTKPWLTLANGDPDPNIQVSIISQRVMDLCWRDRESTIHPGDLFAVDMDLAEENLPAGTLLSVGSAVLEVSDEFNNGCVKWRKRYGTDSYKWINKREYRHLRLRGILCKIVQDGVVRVGDQLAKVL